MIVTPVCFLSGPLRLHRVRGAVRVRSEGR